jgi:microcystin-dependent protein
MARFKKLRNTIAALTLAVSSAVLGTPQAAHAQSEPLLGQIAVFGFNFCPRGWAATEGQLLAINQNTALFSLLGTTYGGDGVTTFGLPDLRGRSMIGVGTGSGLSQMRLGQRGGVETHQMTVNEMPSHNHLVNANNGVNGFADRKGPGNDFLGSPSYNAPGNPAEDISIYADQAPNVTMDPRMIANTGGGQAFGLRDPYLAMTVCIALQGIYPSRP